MAKLTAPLFSFNARGQLGQSLVFMGWKGLKTVRQYLTPANPRSADQVVQRNSFTQAVLAWRQYVQDAIIRAGWDRQANINPKPLSGFNEFVSAAIALIALGGDRGTASQVQLTGGLNVQYNFVNVNDGVDSDEAGTFSLFLGTQPGSLLLEDTGTITGGSILFDVTSVPTNTEVFTMVTKDNINRSGIDKGLLL